MIPNYTITTNTNNCVIVQEQNISISGTHTEIFFQYVFLEIPLSKEL